MTNKITFEYTNALIDETSPYLLQHAHNPVNWMAWGDEAFVKAKSENKLVLVSIGYAACHWCHVMEHEAFENEAIAQIMNAYFVCIKVDREERPDIDQIYMTAVQMISGSGGWPLNCFLLPDGRPVYGGTYFRPNEWKNVLIGLENSFKNEPDKFEKAASEITSGIINFNEIIGATEGSELAEIDLKLLINSWKNSFDFDWGGNNRAPKFPMPVSLSFLLEYYFYIEDNQIGKHVLNTLDSIAHGGIYDQVGGGFARYSVDKYWKVPHFEKMLYDNGQLLSLYAQAYAKTNSLLYKKTIVQTIQFIERELESEDGAFYASYDADSEGVEGKFYVWTKKELDEILVEDERWIIDYYNVTENGNWEHTNILWVTEEDVIIKKLGINESEFFYQLAEINAKLLNLRSTRVRPALDNKILCSWNALVGIGFIDAYAALRIDAYLEKAEKLARFFSNKLIAERGKVHRNYTNSIAKIDGFLDDYAFLIKFYIKLYQHTFNLNFLKQAKLLLDYTMLHFYDKNTSMFYYTHEKAADLIARSVETSDNVIPSSNAVMAHNLLDLSIIYGNLTFESIGKQMLNNMVNLMQQNLPYYALWGALYQRFNEVQYEVVFCGENAISLMNEFNAKYWPNCFVLGTDRANNDMAIFKGRWVDGKTLIYVCKNKVCKMPVESIDEVTSLLE